MLVKIGGEQAQFAIVEILGEVTSLFVEDLGLDNRADLIFILQNKLVLVLFLGGYTMNYDQNKVKPSFINMVQKSSALR
jgi:hypothetical protein